MERTSNTLWHIIAILIIGVWGTTFISTKVLIAHGLAPAEIFMIRFSIAYIGILVFGKGKMFADSLKDELKLLILGVFGGTFYFWAENTALQYSQANNVSFLVCTSPLLTSLLCIALRQIRMTRSLAIGSALALSGMALVIFNGQFVLKLNPMGDSLAVLAALSWAVYSIMMGDLSKRYGSVFITRKVFIYGLVGILPVLLVQRWGTTFEMVKEPAVFLNLIFLGVIASLLCFIGWNKVISKIGVMGSSNYIYLNPIFTLAGSLAILSERITLLSIVGSALILLGVWAAGKGDKKDA